MRVLVRIARRKGETLALRADFARTAVSRNPFFAVNVSLLQDQECYRRSPLCLCCASVFRRSVFCVNGRIYMESTRLSFAVASTADRSAFPAEFRLDLCPPTFPSVPLLGPLLLPPFAYRPFSSSADLSSCHARGAPLRPPRGRENGGRRGGVFHRRVDRFGLTVVSSSLLSNSEFEFGERAGGRVGGPGGRAALRHCHLSGALSLPAREGQGGGDDARPFPRPDRASSD